MRYHFQQRCYKIKCYCTISYYITVRALIWSSFSSAVNYLFPKINNKTAPKNSLFPVQSGVHVSKKAQLIASVFYLQHARWIFVFLWWRTGTQQFNALYPLFRVIYFCFKASLPSTVRCHSIRKNSTTKTFLSENKNTKNHLCSTQGNHSKKFVGKIWWRFLRMCSRSLSNTS